MALSQEQIRKLSRIKNRATAYEIVATKGEQKILVGYSARKSRGGLLAMLAKNQDAWISLTGVNYVDWGKKAADGGMLGEWSIRWSGRTHYEAICNGELPFILDMEVAANA